MGLFWNEAGNAARGRSKPRKVVQIAAADSRGCAACPLDRVQLRTPKMAPTGAEAPWVYVLGETPRQVDDANGEQFSSSSGERLRSLIPSRYDKHVRWNNIVRCYTGEREPAQQELACCRGLQESDIGWSKPLVIAGFGNGPLRWMLGSDRKIADWRGRKVPVEVGGHRCWFFPLFDPEELLHNQDKRLQKALDRCFERDIERMFAFVDMFIEAQEIGMEEELFPYVQHKDTYYLGVQYQMEYGKVGLQRIEQTLEGLRDKPNSIDIETNMLRPYSPERKILTVAVSDYENTLAFPLEHPEARWTKGELKQLLELLLHYLQGKGDKWAHGASFEQEWMHAYFGQPALYGVSWHDTLGQAHILDERSGKGLDDLTQLHFGFRLKSLSNVDVLNLENTPLRDVLPYNALDAKFCFLLSQAQRQQLDELGLQETYLGRNAVTPSFVLMQAKGMYPHQPTVKLVNDELDKEAERINRLLSVQADVVAFERLGNTFNPASPQVLVKFFRDFLKLAHPMRARKGREGKYSTDEEALSKFRHPVAKMVLDLRSITKRRGYITPLQSGPAPVGLDKKNLKNWGKYVHGDGLVHPKYSQFVTVTGRPACEEPNAQNYPRREHKEIRRVYVPPSNHLIMPVDYAQLEARIIAGLSQDKVLCAEVNAEEDIHGEWTDRIGNAFFPDLVRDNRKKCRDGIKQYWTFSSFYGNVLEAVANDLSNEFKVDIPPRELEPFFMAFWDKYGGVLAWQEELQNHYWKHGWVETITGQRRHEPMNKNELINQPVQGTAGQLVIDAQARCCAVAVEFEDPVLVPAINVHDDLTFYVPEKRAEQYVEIIAELMVCTPYELGVPLAVEMSIGRNWCDKEEFAKFTTKDFT